MRDMLFVEVIVDNTSSNTDLMYTYGVPEDLNLDVEAGKRVLVPFGQRDNLLEGLIMNVKSDLGDEISIDRVKNIEYIVDDEKIVSDEMLYLIHWMREEYIAKYIEVIKTILPKGISFKAKKIIRIDRPIDKSGLDNELTTYLNSKKKHTLTALKRRYRDKDISKVVNMLKREKYISIEEDISQDIKKKLVKCVVRRFKRNQLEEIKETINPIAKRQIAVLEEIAEIDTIARADLLSKTGASSDSLRSLKKKGLIDIIEIEENRNPVKREIEEYSKIALNEEQQATIDKIDIYGRGRYLLHGITGSGKTEVYLQLIEKMISEGKDSIVLVPEISLTPQTMDRFIGRFGDDVAIYHSKLSVGERYDEWRKIREGKVKIVIGTRSAIFAPFKNLGLIVIDEEHEQSYKSSMNPKYNTAEVAEVRSSLEGAVLLLGSATPSIEKYYDVESGKYDLLEIKHRANKKSLPNIDLIDMKEELYNGNRSIFSKRLYEEIDDRLKKDEQTILFLNSRGYSRFVSCRSCGYVVKCNRCDVSMTYHAENEMLICHYCGKSHRMFKLCPECKSKYIKHMGVGTQKVEEETRKHFPGARVARLDLDTTSRKHSYEEILGRFKSKEVDILIGTQMISKGLDFPDVTLVGVIMADTVLNIPDYKSSERTFQLMTQVAGRAGRSLIEGEVVIQTYDPTHYSLENSERYDYMEFYRKEIMLRKLFRYPPFCKLVDITVYGRNEVETEKFSERIYSLLVGEIEKRDSLVGVELLGPNPASIYKINQEYRWKILIKSSIEDISQIRDIVRSQVCKAGKSKSSGVKINVDINPSSTI